MQHVVKKVIRKLMNLVLSVFHDDYFGGLRSDREMEPMCIDFLNGKMK